MKKDMKKFLTVLMLCITISGCQGRAVSPAKKVNQSRIEALVSNLQREAESSRNSEDEDGNISLPGIKVVSKGGVDIVSVSRFWVNGAMKLAARSEGDDNLKEAAGLMKSLKKLMVVSYDDCEEGLKGSFTKKISKALDGCELLMEARDDGESVSIYGVSSKDGKTVEDIVLFTPESHALICFFGTLDADRFGEFVEKASRK